jgi:hypothetical protein
LAIAAAGLFALQADDREHNGFEISRGPGFYIQVSLGFIALFPKSLNNTANNANPITNQLKILTDRPMKMVSWHFLPGKWQRRLLLITSFSICYAPGGGYLLHSCGKTNAATIQKQFVAVFTFVFGLMF